MRTTRRSSLAAVLATTATMTLLAPCPVAARGEVMEEIGGDPMIRVLAEDAIPSIDDPEMIPAFEAALLLSDDEPVLGVFDGVTARAYPTWVLDRHEIVNDRLGETPIAATW